MRYGSRVLALLERNGLAWHEKRETGGRPEERWHAAGE
jgi:hypothetical protein